MPLTIINLVTGATGTATGSSSWVPIDHKRLKDGNIPISIFGSAATAFTGSVVMWGAVGTADEVNSGDNSGAPIGGGELTADISTSLFCAFTHIKAVCGTYTTGPFSLRILL